MPSILKDWVTHLGLRHQGVLLSAIRGCDGVPKDDPSKALVLVLRDVLLNAYDPKPSSFIEHVSDGYELRARMRPVLKSHDHYPVHYITHLMYAAEIIGYKWPEEARFYWLWFYEQLCKGLHVNPETEKQMDRRLNADEATFAANGRMP